MGTLAIRGVAAGGTIVNFISGALALVAFKVTNPLHKPHVAYFLWLFTTLNLLSGAGYFLFSGVGGIGDWAEVARGIMPPLVWRPAMSVFGGVLYFLLGRQSAHWLGSLVGSGKLSMRTGKLLTVPAYIAGGFLYCIAGLFNPSWPRPHRHFRCGFFFRWSLGTSLAHLLPASRRAISSASRRAGAKLCLDRCRVYRRGDLHRSSWTQHSFLARLLLPAASISSSCRRTRRL